MNFSRFFRPVFRGLQIVLLLAIMFFNFGINIAYAAPPSNDNFESPTIISALPFVDNIDTVEATQQLADPSSIPCEGQNLRAGKNSVWYRYTPTQNGPIYVDTLGTDYDTYIAVWTGPSLNSLTFVTCDDDVFADFTSQLTFTGTQGTTYHIEVAHYNGQVGGPTQPGPYGGTLRFHVSNSWAGGVSVTADQNVVPVGRPEIGAQKMTYNGFNTGSTKAYVPMLFKDAFGGGYDSALYIQNLHETGTANIIIQYFNTSGALIHTVPDTIPRLSSKGYWLPAIPQLGSSWVGAAVVSSDRNIVAVGRPHIGNEILTYNGFASGSTTMYVPMLFKNGFGGSYDSALYIQNLHNSLTAAITIKYYDTNGNLSCTAPDTIPRLSSKGYWLPNVTCLPSSWVGAAVITSDQNIVAVGRPHIGAQIMAYDGFASGFTTAYLPMMYKDALGSSYDSALYVQNVHPSSPANITIKFYDISGTLIHTINDTIARLSAKGYWLPAISQLGSSFRGSVKVESNLGMVAVGRPHFGRFANSEITTYDGVPSGSLLSYVPMLFRDAFGGSYDSSLFFTNTDAANTANITLELYDTNGNLSCTRTDAIPPLGTVDFFLPTMTCD